MREFPHKKYSLYNPTTGKVVGIKEHYLGEGHKPTICGEHAVLANMINDLIYDPMLEVDQRIRGQLLAQVDIVYDMGKRMGNKMQADYLKSNGRKKGWREGF